LRAEYLLEVDRIQKLKEQIKSVTDEEQKAKLMLILKNERELLVKKKLSGYYKLAKYSLASPEDKARYYTYTNNTTRKSGTYVTNFSNDAEKPEDVLGIYGINYTDDVKNLTSHNSTIVLPDEGVVIER
jgi:hypothetical protein